MSCSTRRLRLVAVAVILALAALAIAAVVRPAAAAAHPLGNFTVNTYSQLEPYADLVRLLYVVDMAEIPTFQEREVIDPDGDGRISETERRAYLIAIAEELRRGLHLDLDGAPLMLQLVAGELSFPPGQGGLDTLRLVLVFEVPVAGGVLSLEYRDENFAGRIGWRETTVRPGDGVTLIRSTAPAQDLTNALRSYPDDLLSSPLDVRAASFAFVSGSGVPAPRVQLGPLTASEAAPPRAGGGFTSLIAVETVSLAVILVSFVVAVGFGAVHALEPGHGKVFVAAYFVGAGGSVRHAMLLGLVVALSHSVGVVAVGVILLFGSRYVVPERLYPWLTLAAGLLVLGLGIALLVVRLGELHRLRHALQGHDHHASDVKAGSSPPSWRSLLALGLVDGFVPSPSTLVVLAAAVSLNRIGLGLLLILAFSLGLAAVLTSLALAIVYARRVISWLADADAMPAGRLAWLIADGGPGGRLVHFAPAGAALVLIGIGLLYTVRALSSAGIWSI